MGNVFHIEIWNTHTQNTVTILKSQIPPVGKFPAKSIKDGAARPPPPPTEETISAASSEQLRKGHSQEMGWDTSNVSLNTSTYKFYKPRQEFGTSMTRVTRTAAPQCSAVFLGYTFFLTLFLSSQFSSKTASCFSFDAPWALPGPLFLQHNEMYFYPKAFSECSKAFYYCWVL